MVRKTDRYFERFMFNPVGNRFDISIAITRFSTILILAFSIFPTTSYCNDVLRLGTASKGGGYYNLGMSIKKISQDLINIEVIETEGSVDNIYQLLEGKIDIAIVQNDIAFFAENGLFPFENQIGELAGIITFYPEPIYAVTRDPNIKNLSQLRNLTVNIGPSGSGLRTDSKIILNSIDIWDDVIKKGFNPQETLANLAEGEIQAAFINNLTEDHLIMINSGELFIISLPPHYIENLRRTYHYIDEFKSSVMNEDISTVAVKSILVGRKDIDPGKIYLLTKKLHQDFYKLDFPGKRTSDQYEQILHSMSLRNWHVGSQEYYQEIGKIGSQIYKKIWRIFTIIFFALALIIALDISLYAFNRRKLRLVGIHSRLLRYLRHVNAYVVRHKYIMVVLFMLITYLTIIAVVQNLEHNWAITHNTISKFDNPSIMRNFVWILNISGSGYNDNLFPQSLPGKLLVGLIPLIGIGGFFALLGFLTSDHIKSKILEARGMITKMTKNHIIICGWNENVPFLVKNLMHENNAHIRPVIILAEVQEDLPLEKYGIDNRQVGYIRGEATNKKDLERANLADADIAVIVTDSDSTDPDAKNVLKILTIEKYCQELESKGARKNRANIYTIAELQNPESIVAARDAFVDEVISFRNIKTKILVQSILNPGVSTFLNNILTYDDNNDFYSVQLKRKSKLVNKTYDELLFTLREHDVLLLSINVFHGQSKKELEKFKTEHHLSRSVLTNPIDIDERNYRTQEGDILILLAQYQRTVDSAIKKIEKLK